MLSRRMDPSQAQAQCEPSNKINSKNGTENQRLGKFVSEQMQKQLFQPAAYNSYSAVIPGHSPLPPSSSLGPTGIEVKEEISFFGSI